MSMVSQEIEALLRRAASLVDELPKQRPLVHHLMGHITAGDAAAVALGAGASPVMTDLGCELHDILGQADALLLNMATPRETTRGVFLRAVRTARKLECPVVLDPVGAAATSLRRELGVRLLEEGGLWLVKGNLAEIKALLGLATRARGVDSEDTGGDHLHAARRMHERYGVTVVVTGREDVVVGTGGGVRCMNGHPMLGQVVGTGCMTGSLVACMLGVGGDTPLAAAVAGLSLMNIAGEHAAPCAGGPGSFRSGLLDAIHHLDGRRVYERARVEAVEPCGG